MCVYIDICIIKKKKKKKIVKKNVAGTVPRIRFTIP